MEHLFTAAAERALAEAARWRQATSVDHSPDRFDIPSLLLGLLAESECRAAELLRQNGIDREAVLSRWPTLVIRSHNDPSPDTNPDSPFLLELQASFASAIVRFVDQPRPLMLATEHVLLGLADASHEVAHWLRAKGIDPNEIEGEIRERHGYSTVQRHCFDSHLLEWPPEPAGPLQADGLPETVCPATVRGEVGTGAETQHADPREASTHKVIVPALSRPIAPQSPADSPMDARFDAGERIGVLRVIDAAANRAREGMRVVEDYVRFVLDDRHLTEQFKQLRHELAAALSRIPLANRLAARETQADVGTGIAVQSEFCRETAGDVLSANFTRLQEALRSLEEFGKTIDPQTAGAIEQLRYRTYTLQRSTETTRRSLERLGSARLYVLIDGRPTVDEFVAVTRSLVEAGVHVIQLRDKRLDDRRLIERGRLLRQITGGSRTIFIINDRPDLAVLTEADGVHVGQDELTVKDARRIVGPRAFVGVSTHSIEQARQAVLDGADYIGVGPTFPSGTKTFDCFPGVELLRAVAAEIRLPAFAIGGITLGALKDVADAGFLRVAVSGGVLSSADPTAAAQAFLEALRALPTTRTA